MKEADPGSGAQHRWPPAWRRVMDWRCCQPYLQSLQKLAVIMSFCPSSQQPASARNKSLLESQERFAQP